MAGRVKVVWFLAWLFGGQAVGQAMLVAGDVRGVVVMVVTSCIGALPLVVTFTQAP